MTGEKTAAIGSVAEPILTSSGFDLEEVVVLTPPGRRDVRIIVDRDGGASLDALADLSREVGEALDEAAVMGERPYDLELTTPGVSRQLTKPRHWRRAVGRPVAIEYTVDGRPTGLQGRVGALGDGVVTVVRNTKGRITTTEVPLDAVTSAVVDVDFRTPGEAELAACGLDDAEIARRRGSGE